MRVNPLTLLAIISVACIFGAERNLVSTSDVTAVHALAMTHDGGSLMVADSWEQDLVNIDPDTGVEVRRHGLWGGGEWRVTDLTPDDVVGSAAWALHANGYMVHWTPSLNYDDFHSGPPMGDAVARDLCSVEVADGNHYVSTIDTVQNPLAYPRKLYRRSPTGSWSSITLPGGWWYGCPHIAYDEFRDVLVVADDSGLASYAPDLVPVASVAIGTSLDSVRDIDVMAGIAVVVGVVPGFYYGVALTVDLDTGDVLDMRTSTAWPGAAQLVNHRNSGTFEAFLAINENNASVRGVMLDP